jgi:protein arginine kinase activator
LDGLLKTMHKGTRHVGKVPETLRQNRDLADRLKSLQKKLTKAIEEEDFEEAAILRDEIKQTTARLASITTPAR